MATSLDALHRLETAVEASGVPVFARSRTTDDPGRLLGLLADENAADVVLVPEDPTFTPPGGGQAAVAPTARLHLGGATTTEGDVVVALHGTADDVHALDLAARIAASRGSALRVTGSPARKAAASLDRLRTAGLVTDAPAGGAGLTVNAGEVTGGGTDDPTLGVWGGRDDGVDRLVALVDRLGRDASVTDG